MITAQIIIGIICGAVCAILAHHKGRNWVGWLFFGFFFGIIPLIILLVIADLREDQQRRAQLSTEQHRLREQVRQERVRHEAFQQHVAQRLDRHDTALGLDTRATATLTGSAMTALPGADGTSPVALLAAPAPDPASTAVERRWYYECNGETCGPVSEEDMHALFANGTLTPQSLVWNEELSLWTPASGIPAFQSPKA